jgi:hypothetical protein
MPHSPNLQTLAAYLTGTFDNRSQAMDEPVWYVGLQVWHRATHLFADDSITIFADYRTVKMVSRRSFMALKIRLWWWDLGNIPIGFRP